MYCVSCLSFTSLSLAQLRQFSTFTALLHIIKCGDTAKRKHGTSTRCDENESSLTQLSKLFICVIFTLVKILLLFVHVDCHNDGDNFISLRREKGVNWAYTQKVLNVDKELENDFVFRLQIPKFYCSLSSSPTFQLQLFLNVLNNFLPTLSCRRPNNFVFSHSAIHFTPHTMCTEPTLTTTRPFLLWSCFSVEIIKEIFFLLSSHYTSRTKLKGKVSMQFSTLFF